MEQPSEGLPLQNKKWPLRSETAPGQKNVAHPALVDKLKIYLSPLHIKLGLIKISEKAMDKESEGSGYVLPEFPKVSEAKKEAGIFVGLQITQLFEDQDFSRKLDSTERRAWKASENVCRNFLGNEKAENYSEIVQELISLYNNISSRLHFLNSHFDFFPLKTEEPFPMNTAKGSIKVFPKLNGGTAKKGVQVC